MKGMVGKKNSSWTVFIIVSVLLISTVTMYFRFLYYSKNIRATVVKQEINQIELTSNYITKIFHTEMEDCVDVLRENARAYYLSDAENTLEDTVEFLQNIKQHTDFTVVGVIRPDGRTIGIEDYDISNIHRSVTYLMSGAVPYEFRTTVVREFHQRSDFASIGRWIRGAEQYYLQQFVDSGDLIRPGLHGYGKEIMEQALEVVKKDVKSAQLRGL